ncbi:MAG: hypothetical protein ABSF25_14420 [Bryobacteraceae bacterium]
MKLAPIALLLLAAAAGPASAQSWDTSGNGLLNGTYYFREVFYLASGDAYGDLGQAISVFGNITFSGAGTYTLSCNVADSNLGDGTCLEWLQYYYGSSATTSGTYSISASGYGFLSNPLSPTDSVYGLVSQEGGQNIFVGSSTESGFNDMFVAAPYSTGSNNATFKGSYWIADMDFPSGTVALARSYMYQLNPDGAGNLGSNISVTGYVGDGGSTVVSQTISSKVAYAFSNGAASLGFPTSSGLISGQKFLYISPDGNFVFGGSPTGWDFFVGVRTGTGAPNFGGLYYQAGIDEPVYENVGDLDTYYGAVTYLPSGSVGHQRLAQMSASTAIDYTYGDTYTASAATYSTAYTRYAVGAGGAVRIGSGIGADNMGLNVALAAPTLSGAGVYLNPLYIVNAASWAPFTEAIVPGEFITLFGTGMAPSGASAAATVPFPPILGGVQVMIDNLPAPLYTVSPGEISAIVPYGIGTGVVTIQVINNGALSNTVTTYAGTTAPGVFTLNEDGLGYGAVQHNADYSLVTAAKPAQPGEYLIVYLSGLGAVSPAVADGSAAPGSPSFSLDTNSITVFIGGQSVTPVYSGLVPGSAGLYQLDVQVPTGLTAGDNDLDIEGPDSYTSEALISVGTGAAASVATPAAAARRAPRPTPAARPAAACGLGLASCAGRPRSSRQSQ